MPDKNTSQVGELDSAPFQLEPNPSHHILVVDDEPDIRQLSTEVLTDSGYAVDAAEDGAVAWQALNTDSYDLLITDHNIPKVSGVELLKKMRAARMNLPVIMATGNLPAHEFARKPWLKPDAMLHKPYTVAEMLKTVKKVLREADSIADSSHLFKFKYRDMNDNKISQAEEPLGAPLQYPINSPHRILVVDDNSDVRQFSVDVLVGSGYDVEAAKDGAAGWEALQAKNYDLVITDNKMPRMTGIEMIEKLRFARMAVPVIMATRNLPAHEFARKPWLRPDATLQRPCSNDDLLEAVKKVLHTDDGNDGLKETLLPKYL
jgi:DNA-binding response OmpR family regulator